MSMHKVPLTPTEEAGFHAHGLQRNIGKPSQLADVFRQGVAWGIAAERERAAPLDAELQEVLDWARKEKAPLREQEIASIVRVLAKFRA